MLMLYVVGFPAFALLSVWRLRRGNARVGEHVERPQSVGALLQRFS